MKQFNRIVSRLGRLAAGVATLSLLASPVLAQIPERLRSLGSVPAVNARLDSLEQVALHAPNLEARGLALIHTTQLGKVWARHGEPAPIVVYPGIVARLRRIYPSAAPLHKELIVQSLVPQGERSEAIAFLRELTRSFDVGSEHIGIAEQAVGMLSMMGPAGEDELRRLHLSGEADPVIQKMLDRLARTGYRHRPGG